MKKLSMILFMIIIIINKPIYSNDLKTKEDFLPIPLDEKPIGNLLINEDYKVACIVITTITTTSGIGFTLYNAYKLLESNVVDPENKEFQGQIFFLTTSLLFTVISSWFLKIILTE